MDHASVIPALAGFLTATAIWLPVLTVAMRRLRHANLRAAHDPQTGLAHRDTARAFYRSRQARGQTSTLMLIDLDRFKQINDSLGHHAGNMIIEKAAQLLRDQTARWGALAARLGGDEFAIITPAVTPDEHADQVRQLRTVLSQPVTVAAHHGPVTLRVTATIGIAVGHGPLEHAQWETMTRAADLALYHAKRARHPFQFHHPDLAVPAHFDHLRMRDLPAVEDGGEPS